MAALHISLLKKKPRRSLGLDIGSYYVKLVEVERKNNSYEIINAGLKPVREQEDVSLIIKDLCQELKVSTTDVNISLSGENVVARYLTLPKMSVEELKKALVFELEDHIPFKPEEVYTDYLILGEEPNAKNKMRVFLVAAKKIFLETMTKTVHGAGLTPQVVTIDALALKNTFYYNYPSKLQTNIAILNIGDKITNLLIAYEQIPYFVRDSRFGGDAVTSLIRTKLDLDKKKAEELKHTLKVATPEITEIIKAAMANLLNEVFVSLDFYESLTEQRIDEIYISGGSSSLFGLKEFLGGYLNIKIIPLNTFQNFTFAPSASREKLLPLAHYFAVAIGTALEEP